MAQWRVGLWNAPPEIISEITWYIRGIDVVLLWMCGSKRLNYGMSEQGGVRRLMLAFPFIRDLRRWPTIIPLLKNLEVLGVDVGSPNMIEGDPIQAFKLWPKGIRELHLCFRNAEKCWSRCSSIGELFPNLESLTLSGWSAFGAASLAKLPSTVTYLDLVNNSTLTTEILFQHLPNTILHLKLGLSTRLDANVCSVLPATLQTLHMPHGNAVSVDDVKKLPPTITDLHLKIQAHMVSQSIPFLPMGLKHWKLSTYWNQAFSIASSVLPKNLVTLNLSDGIVDVDFENLPQTLTELDVGRLSVRYYSFAHLPSGLRLLRIGDYPLFCDPICDKHIQQLPRTLTWLNLNAGGGGSLTDACAALLPRSLTFLQLPVALLSGECFQHLPRQLSVLNLPYCSPVLDHHIADLPRFLQELNIQNASQLTDAMARLLPQSIKKLNIDRNQNFTFACVPDLPPFMTDFELGQTGVADRYRSERKRRAKTGCAYIMY